MKKTRRLTGKQKLILEYIKDYKSQNDGNSPSLRDIADYFNCSVGAIVGHLAALRHKGFISQSYGKYRAIQILEVGNENNKWHHQKRQ